MKKFFFIILLVIISLQVFSFYKDLSLENRIKLAESYYLVGEKYNQIKKNSGQSYIKKAYDIYPEFKPELISRDLSDLPENLNPERIIAEIREEENTRILINYRFKRMTRAFLAKDITSTMSFFDSAVFIAPSQEYMQNSELESLLSSSVQNVPLEVMEPENLYNLDNITIVKAPQGFQAIYPKCYILKVNSNINFGSTLSFWTQEQTYYYRQVNGKYTIFGIGDIEDISVIEDYADSIGIIKDIQNQLLAAMDAYLNKDSEKISSFLADTIKIIPMETTITKEEAQISFEGFLEQIETDLDLTAGDIVTDQGIEVETVYSEENDFPQGTMVARVTIKDEHKDNLTFWSSYSDYYFMKIQGAWKIIAIG